MNNHDAVQYAPLARPENPHQIIRDGRIALARSMRCSNVRGSGRAP
jgi:hypothetical protein